MIDTDKYEGHTEGEWDLHSMGDGWTIGQLKKIDRTLMQDAPLLLAEVKRLREVLKLFEQGFRLEDWLGIYHKDVLREWCNYLGIPEVDE
jgi:hypothetical protein